MGLQYRFVCDRCGVAEDRDTAITIAKKTMFCLDEGWQDWPPGWRYGGREEGPILFCPACRPDHPGEAFQFSVALNVSGS